MSKYWEPCPRCNSNKVKTFGKGTFFLLFFGSSGCLNWIGFLFFPVLILAAILILVSPLAFLLPKIKVTPKLSIPCWQKCVPFSICKKYYYSVIEMSYLFSRPILLTIACLFIIIFNRLPFNVKWDLSITVILS